MIEIGNLVRINQTNRYKGFVICYHPIKPFFNEGGPPLLIVGFRTFSTKAKTAFAVTMLDGDIARDFYFKDRIEFEHVFERINK